MLDLLVLLMIKCVKRRKREQMNGEKKKDEEFKEQCQRYLEGLSLMDLRCYGRFLNRKIRQLAYLILKPDEAIFSVVIFHHPPPSF